MKTEELKAIREWYRGSGPYNTGQLERDVRALLDEVDRLNRLLDMHRGGKNRHEVFLTHPITGKKEFVGTADNDDSSPEPE